MDQFSWLVDLPAMPESLKYFHGQLKAFQKCLAVTMILLGIRNLLVRNT